MCRGAFSSPAGSPSPTPPDSVAATRIVTVGALEGFKARLRERAFEGISRRDERDFRIRDATGRLARYTARCPLGGVVLDVECYAAIWRGDGGYLLAGGAYPTGVSVGDANATALRSAIDPERFRSELLGLLRSVQ